MRKISLMLGILAVVCNCSHTYSPKVELLRPWGEDLAKETPFEDSYLSIFESRGKILRYIAGRHAISNNDRVVELVENSLKKYPPEVLVLEGFDPSANFIKLREEARECSTNFVKCGEGFAAIYHGSSHLSVQLKVLEEMMGTPQFMQKI